MAENEFFSLPPCGRCGQTLATRYHTFDRNVERYAYDRFGNTIDEQTTVTVLHSDNLGQYCSADCVQIGAEDGLQQRGIRLTYPGAGPLEACAMCSNLVDMTEPHVAYQTMDQTETNTSGVCSVQPHSSEILAVVCPRCDSDLPVDECEAEPIDQEDEPLWLNARNVPVTS